MSTVAGRGRAGSRGRSTNRIDANRVRSSEISYRAATATTKTKDFFTKDLRGGNMHRRIVSMFTVVAILLSLLGVRVALLQTLWASDYREASVSQRTRVQVMRAERGSILDRNGRELALPIPTRTVFADPRSVVDPVGVASVVAGVLQLDPQAESELAAKLQNKQSSFVYIARQADKEVADAILALGLKGVSSYRESGRALSSASLQAVVGRTDIDGVGISGLELKYHDLLTGVDGRIVREVNSSGKSIAAGSGEVLEPKSGGQLTTTIDRTIQFQVDGIVKQQVERLGARGGMAIVMDTKTGEIYAMSNIRINEDGSYSSESGNFSSVEANEPGSVAKVFSIAAAINEGAVNTSSSFSVPGYQVFDKGTQWEYRVTDAYPHGLEDMSVRKIFVDSSNIGTIQISRTLDTKKNHEYLKLFGFGTKTAVEYPGESRGSLRPVSKWQGTEKFSFSYGYGYTSTALQLAAAVNVVANKGVYVAPKMVLKTTDKDGVETATPASETRQVLSASTAQIMTSLMTDVVCYGTGKLAKLPGLSVAGKTGTAYKLQENGTYTNDEGARTYFASFVGFLPANNPRMTVLVSIDEPDPYSNDRFGGTAAAPVFARIGQVLVNELNIRPEGDDLGCVGSRPAELGPSH
ncbi:MAG: peptidoglycan D,D-transpeptidase FtsI family protein [Ilumatobacteraceae bacterium]|jgi:cell division protein FtsI (penicillin-binding protein 3)